MRLAQDDKMVHALAPDRSDQPFGKAILSRRRRCNGLVPDAHGANSARDDGAVDSIPIPNEVLRSLIPGERLGQLACDPFRRRVCCDVDPDQVSAVQPNDDEGIEQIEANCRNNEQVHGGNVGEWFRRKVRHPWLGGPRRWTMYCCMDRPCGASRI